MKTAAKVFFLFLVVALSSCSDDLSEIEAATFTDTSVMEVGNNGNDDDEDCKGNCNDD